ncbi:MAG TPA: hypothetical protein VHZ50_07245 [Puia sp.]|nr:hypothetical protein [Puia sp.]
MKKSLPLLFTALFFVWSNTISAHPGKNLIYHSSFSGTNDSLRKNDSIVKKNKDNAPHVLKICACQVLKLQSANYRARNFALYSERTNKKSYSYDVNKARWILEREKKHIADLFYDKVDVLDDIVEVTDCRSMFLKMKKQHKTLILYDIVDADIKK